MPDYKIERDDYAHAVTLHLFIEGRERAGARIDKQRGAWRDAEVRVNWSAIGTVSPEYAATFAAGLGDLAKQAAAEFAIQNRPAESLPICKPLSDGERAIVAAVKEREG